MTNSSNCAVLFWGDGMITFDEITNLFTIASEDNFCIEINFCVGNEGKYLNCWMGKTIKDKKATFWFGLTEDGSEPYEYEDFEAFSSGQVFNGQSLKEIWTDIELLSIDGCEPEERIKNFKK